MKRLFDLLLVVLAAPVALALVFAVAAVSLLMQ